MEIWIPILIIGVIALIAGIGLGIANHFMAVKGDPKAEAILAELPGANCGACGFSGCSGYADALAKSKNLKTTLCAVGGDPVAQRISQILGVKPSSVERMTAEVRCRGNHDCSTTKMNYQGIASCKAAMAYYGGDGACRYGCMGYGDCVSVCEFSAIRVCNGVAIVNQDACRACGKCVNTCPKKIIAMVPVRFAAKVLCSNTDKGPQTKAVCSVGCLGCRLCVKACEYDAISFNGSCAVIDSSKCVACGKCAETCKFGVITLTN